MLQVQHLAWGRMMQEVQKPTTKKILRISEIWT